jgi:hypothetical protein
MCSPSESHVVCHMLLNQVEDHRNPGDPPRSYSEIEIIYNVLQCSDFLRVAGWKRVADFP